MNEFTIKVSPEIMANQAQTIQSCVDNIRRHFESIDQKVKGAAAYWEGEAASLHLSTHNRIKKESDILTRKLSEHPNDLLKMAGIYRSGEQQNAQDAISLQNNIFG